mmetsp:Transcript_25700/g.30434  ORF Transcript_25700/g.30434 Transcript_25700/m.30434 type:complete len:91 (+) Transcript_25700:229-501(+)
MLSQSYIGVTITLLSAIWGWICWTGRRSGASTRLGTGTGRSLAVALSHKEARFTKTTLTLLHTACPNMVVTESDSAVASNTSTTAIKEMT